MGSCRMNMKKVYIEATVLKNDASKVVDELARFNPGIKNNSHISLATLAKDAGDLAYHYNNLRVDILKIHEENKLNEF